MKIMGNKTADRKSMKFAVWEKERERETEREIEREREREKNKERTCQCHHTYIERSKTLWSFDMAGIDLIKISYLEGCHYHVIPCLSVYMTKITKSLRGPLSGATMLL